MDRKRVAVPMKHRLSSLLLALGLAAGLMTTPALAAAFTDVPSTAWYAQAVGKVSEAGLMNGTTETTFSPDDYVTRGMVVAVLWRLAGEPEPQTAARFSDVQDWYFYAKAVAWAQENGVAAGLGDGTFGGGSTVTREQLAVFLYRYAQFSGQEIAAGVLDPYPDQDQIHDWARAGMAHAVGAGLITGDDAGDLTPGGAASRAQLAVIMQRIMTPAVG